MSKEIVLVTPRVDFINVVKPSKITSLSGAEKNVYGLEKGQFSSLVFSGYKRPECEQAYDYIQMIPYIILRDIDQETGVTTYLTYKRGKKGAENKLHDKYSVGVGGHISVNDFVVQGSEGDHVELQTNGDSLAIVIRELIKEIQEETGFDITAEFSHDDLKRIVLEATPFYLDEGPDSVNSYHFALPIAINVNGFAGSFISNEPGIIEKLSFKTPAELEVLAKEGKLEAWSDIVLRNFIPMVIDPEYFKQATGNDPVNDDIGRANCSRAGSEGHMFCGWDFEVNKPNTMAKTN